MKLNTQYSFKEMDLGQDFASESMKDFRGLINMGQSFTVVSMPGVGVSYFLKYLVTRDFAHFSAEGANLFIYVDLYNLPTLNQHEFYRMFLKDLGGNPDGITDEQTFIEAKDILKKLATNLEKIVIVFSRFDQLKKALDANFLSNLQSLSTLEEGKIVLIFTAIKPLEEIAPEAVVGGNLAFYSKILYFTPYSKKDLKKLFLLDHTESAHTNLDDLIELSGGHNQLFNIILNSHKQQNLLLDKFVKLQLKDLFDYLDYQQRKEVQNIALGKKVENTDEYLEGVGYVKKDSKLFSPILEQYIKENLPIKLPVKEKKLFNLLRENIGKVVTKDQIFEVVWEGQESGATDWALDALIYRLRKHPFIKTHGYLIESLKKVGYSLIQT